MSSLHHDQSGFLAGLKVLWVDDDAVFLEIAKATLNKIDQDIDVRRALNGQVALQELERACPDIVFLDINMPVLDGWEFLKNLKKARFKISFPICIVSSSIDPIDREHARRFSEIKLFIEKPINYQKLRSALALLVDNSGEEVGVDVNK